MRVVVPIADARDRDSLGIRMLHFDTIVSALEMLGCQLTHLPNVPGEWYFMIDNIVVRVGSSDDLSKIRNSSSIRLQMMAYVVAMTDGMTQEIPVTSLEHLRKGELYGCVEKMQVVGCNFNPPDVLDYLTDFANPTGILSEPGA